MKTNAHSTLFVRSGYIRLDYDSLRNFSLTGYGWSNTATTYYGAGTWDANAYTLAFDAGTVYPSNGPNNRWQAFPVRCLVILVWF